MTHSKLVKVVEASTPWGIVHVFDLSRVRLGCVQKILMEHIFLLFKNLGK